MYELLIELVNTKLKAHDSQQLQSFDEKKVTL